jgi:hypothetical protein
VRAPPRYRPGRLLASVLVAPLLVSCGDGASLLFPTAAEVALGTRGQADGRVGEALDPAPTIRITDTRGNPVPGVPVTFRVEEGGGSVTPATVRSDRSGEARIEHWTLGEVAGANVLVAEVPGLPPTRFEAVAAPGPPAEARSDPAELPEGEVGETIRADLGVLVLDRFGNPVPDIAVRFAVTAGGGSVERAEDRTGPDGRASAGAWVLGTVAGSQRMEARAGDLAPTAFETVAHPGAPDRIELADFGTVRRQVAEQLDLPVVVRVEDEYGNAVPGVPVTIAASDGGKVVPEEAVTDATGQVPIESWTLGTTAGPQSLTFGAEGLEPATLTIQVAPGPPAGLEKRAGDLQTGGPGQLLPVPLRVRVTDAYGNPVPGTPVTFQAAAGSGSVAPSGPETDGAGETASAWTLGPDPGAQLVTAFIPAGAAVEFTATAEGQPVPPLPASEFTIALHYVNEPTPSQRHAFEQAVARWQSLVIGDLQPIHMILGPGECGASAPALNRVVDDVLIFVTLEPIDGPGGVLGSAGPCWVRVDGFLPIVGLVRLDTADLDMLEGQGRLGDVILHEIGHVLGIGTLWNLKGFLQNRSLPNNPGVDTHFSGPAAIAAFDQVGGTGHTGAKVPVENTQGGQGTRDAHWRESVLTNELMTGFLNPGANPLSRITVASLQDLGYRVNLAGADPFSLGFGLRAAGEGAEAGIHMMDDVLGYPIKVVDAFGRHVGELRPE